MNRTRRKDDLVKNYNERIKHCKECDEVLRGHEKKYCKECLENKKG